MTRNAICLCADRNMLAPAMFVADSAQKRRAGSSNRFDVIVFVGPNDALAADRAWGARRGIEIADGLPLSQVADIPLQLNRLSPMTLARLLVPEHLAPRYDRILYLDADTMIEDDVGRIFSLDTGAAALAAVPAARFWEGSTKRRKATLAHFRDLGMSEPFRYFNSGVLYIDVGKWNADSIGHRALQFIRRNPGLCILPDEDALNGVLDGRIAELSPIWNMRARAWAHRRVRAAADPVIVHFDGPLKPWIRPPGELRVSEFERIFRTYRQFLADTPWSDWLFEQRAPDYPAGDTRGSATRLREERAYADAFLRFGADHAFADVDQGIAAREHGRLRLASPFVPTTTR